MALATTHDLLSAALEYASRGWHVIPLHDVTQGHCSCGKGAQCTKPGKHPRIEDWTGDGASIDPTQIRQWWQHAPHANVGIQTGQRSRLAVLDIDPRNGGDLALDDLVHAYGSLPETPMALSGSKGPHYYFALDGPLGKFDPATGVNLLADGALVVAPPSLHHSGNPYAWEASSHPDDVALAPMPDWLRALGEAKASGIVHGVDLPDILPGVELQHLKVSPRVKFLILTGTDPDDPQRYPSRSEALFGVIQALLSAGHDDATIAAVCLDKRYAISEKVWQQKNPKSPFYESQTRHWVAKEIARAKAKHQEPARLQVSQQPTGSTVSDMTQNASAGVHQHQNGSSAPPVWGTPGQQSSAAHPVIVSMDEVEKRPVEWLWWPYIAVGKVCMVDGDPGVGKTLLAIQLAANLSRGYPLPDQQGKPTMPTGAPAPTVFIATEDDLADTMKGRLERAGADCSLIKVFNEFVDEDGHTRPFTLFDMPFLEQCLETVKPRLVVIDAIQAVLGGKIDINRANQVTALLRELSNVAARYHCAILCIRHPSKPGQNIAKLIHRGMGSQAFIGSARMGLFVEEHPADPTKVMVVQSKSADDRARTQIFSKRGGQFEWCGVTRVNKEMMAGAGKGPSPQAFLEACFWLEDRLKDGRSYAAKDIQEEMKDEGLTHGVAFTAKKALGVVHSKTPAGTFTWYLPPLSVITPSTSTTSSTSSTSSTSYSSQNTTAYTDTESGTPPPEVEHGASFDVSDVYDVVDVYDVDGVVIGDISASDPLISDSPPGGIPAFTAFTVASLWCATCQAAQPVTETAGVIACTTCGAQVGTKTVTAVPPNGTPPAPAVAVSPLPGVLVEACPQCHCTSLLMLGDYRKCPLCSWKGKATAAALASPGPEGDAP